MSTAGVPHLSLAKHLYDAYDFQHKESCKSDKQLLEGLVVGHMDALAPWFLEEGLFASCWVVESEVRWSGVSHPLVFLGSPPTACLVKDYWNNRI